MYYYWIFKIMYVRAHLRWSEYYLLLQTDWLTALIRRLNFVVLNNSYLKNDMFKRRSAVDRPILREPASLDGQSTNRHHTGSNILGVCRQSTYTLKEEDSWDSNADLSCLQDFSLFKGSCLVRGCQKSFARKYLNSIVVHVFGICFIRQPKNG